MTGSGEGGLLSLKDESLPLLHELGEMIELGIIALDTDLVVRGWNRWMEGATGIDRTNIVGRALLEVFADLRGSAAENALRRALDGATTVWAHQFHRYFIPVAPPPGYERFPRMQQSARIVPTRRDEQPGVLVLIQDVTERVAREEDLRAALELAETANQAKSEFLASMSHELRTPLSAIIGYMDLLGGDMVGRVEAKHKIYFARVKAAAQHLISIIEEILTFARVEAGKEEVFPESVDVAALARDVEELLEPQALLKHVSLAVTVPGEPVVLTTDSTKLRQILINLLGNALKFTDVGEVSLDLCRDGQHACFRIVDTGPGIAPAHLDKIFDPFTQVDQSLKRTKGGTGLGLPVSRRLANLLGGELSVESTVGAGTTFTLRLPLNVGDVVQSDSQEFAPQLIRP